MSIVDDELGNENIAEYETYEDFLNTFVYPEDLMYLEEEELARDVKELYAMNKGEIKCKADFDRKKRELASLNRTDDPKHIENFSKGKEYPKGSFLDLLQERESEVRSGRRSTIIFIRYKESKGKETSAYIDYRERLKYEDMEYVFKGEKDLIPKPTDLSYYNWGMQKVSSNDSTFFRVDAGPKERLSFKNNTDRKVINVDYEYASKHKSDVKRTTLIVPRGANINMTSVDPKKAREEARKLKKKAKNKNVKKGENDFDDEDETLGYQQIVIFDYETRSK